jgi:hypothetical protein
MVPRRRLNRSRYVGLCLYNLPSRLALLFAGKKSCSQGVRKDRGKRVEIGRRNQNRGVMPASNSDVVFDDGAVFATSCVEVSR